MPDTANRPNIGRFFKNTPSNKNKPPSGREAAAHQARARFPRKP
ncbi:hypothetical protein [Neisseria polysaccharea]|nr:hypothetical protein [Neisseria polysaccharea]